MATAQNLLSFSSTLRHPNIARGSPPTSCASATIPTWLATTYPPSRISSACSCLLTTTVPPNPTFTAPTSTGYCTEYTYTAPTTTVANFCDPTFYSNFVATPTIPAGATASHAKATVSPVGDRLTCCEVCAETFNCVYWKYQAARPQTPSPAFPGGFDPWNYGRTMVAASWATSPTTPAVTRNLRPCAQRPDGQLDEQRGRD
ncbi:hypothetical protein LZ32DRAFT_669480 [Colletotrichum eremochloae]|nr:hypothetical protein LZ32DRAFT_669480 [Colletotrichum eremochloae]